MKLVAAVMPAALVATANGGLFDYDSTSNGMLGGAHTMMPRLNDGGMASRGMMGNGSPYSSQIMGGQQHGMYRRRLAATPATVNSYFPGMEDVPIFGSRQQQQQTYQKPANAGNPDALGSLAAMQDKCCALCPAGGIGCLARCSKECGNLDECTAAGRGAYAAVCQLGCFKFPPLYPRPATQPTTPCEDSCIKVGAEMCRASNNCELDYGCVVDQCEAAAREFCATEHWRDFLRRHD